MFVYGREGCVIDQSHGDARTLDLRIVAFAEAEGFDAGFAAEPGDEELREGADEAVEYLNLNACGPRMYFEVDDNSLFLRADEPTEQEYDDWLDEMYGEVEIAGLTCSTSRALRDLDPVAYRCGFADYVSDCFDD